MPGFPIYVINLDGSADRLSKINAALTAQNTAFTRVSAYDGRQMNPMGIPEYDSQGARSYIGRDLTGGEIGCYFSHIDAAHQFLQTEAEFGLVLEDDAEVSANAIGLINSLIFQQTNRPVGWYICHVADPKMKYLSAIETFAANGDARTLLSDDDYGAFVVAQGRSGIFGRLPANSMPGG